MLSAAFITTTIYCSCYRSYSFSLETLEYLLKNQKMDPNQTTSLGESPLQLVAKNPSFSSKDKKQSAVRLLLAYGAKPPYETWNHYLKVDGPQKPAEAYSKLFLMGDPGGGKSTLAESLETEAEGFDRFLNRLRKVGNVDAKTAGIVTKDIISKSLGRVTVYDLAGHSEFYASHDTALRSALAGSPSSIIVLVADMRGGGKSFETAILKWCSFAENLYEESTDNLPFLIIVGSHEDSSSKADSIACQQVIARLQKSDSFISFRFKGFLSLDCRYSVSRHMEELRAILTDCSQLLKQEELLSFREHCFLISVLDMYRDVPAVTVKEVIANSLETAKCSSSSPQYFLPTDATTMDDICSQMNKRGNILYLSNSECPENSWIVLKKDIYLQRVTGSVFAPENFKEHTSIATGTGIVPISKLAACFPDIDTNLIVSFMCHLQFCLEVIDPDILKQLAVSGDHSECERFLFFPSLVTIKAPVGVWGSGVEFTHQSTWILQCHNPDQFFPSRFLHLVIHRLSFSFAMAPNTTSNQVSIQTKCTVWKDGIFWISLTGVNVIAQFTNGNRLTVLIGTRVDCELRGVRLRSKIISTVLKAQKDCCPKVPVDEFLAKIVSSSNPFTDERNIEELVEITDFSRSVIKCDDYCYCYNQSSAVVKLSTLLHFEPFMDLGEDIINELFSKEEFTVTDESLAHISDRACSNTDMFIKMLDISRSSLESKVSSAPTGAASKLLCALQLWRNKEGSYSSLCKRLIEYSVFAGRNPLVSSLFIAVHTQDYVVLFFHFCLFHIIYFSLTICVCRNWQVLLQKTSLQTLCYQNLRQYQS